MGQIRLNTLYHNILSWYVFRCNRKLKSLREYKCFIFIYGMGRNIPELVFVSLVAFFVYDLLTLKMASAQVVKTSVGNNSPSQDSSHPDDHLQSIAFNHRPQRVWQQRVYCHAIREAETTLTIKLQRRRAGGYKGKRKL